MATTIFGRRSEARAMVHVAKALERLIEIRFSEPIGGRGE